ncbi:unnamed protein product [Candidula unifasciata]|uniref:G-protein coupled receptors family 1 profile domain-containing protein n=1 Tax=Candidula unifasciata TaxID=100452 RepID=A0A8S3ZLL4_9EUPU|nr:unnamed protein product [Candidula unifasciata]
MEVTETNELNSTSSEIASNGVDPISLKMRHLLQVVTYVFMCGTVSLLGIITNILNVVVFVRQGFRETINISLLGLAVADLLSVTTMFVISLSFIPLLDVSHLQVNLFDVLYLTVGWPHVSFNRISSTITAYISLERCLCVTLPLQVKDIITPLKTKVVIGLIYVIIITFFTPFYFVNKLDWCYNKIWNRTILSLTFAENRVEVETATFPIHSVFIPLLAQFIVIVCTLVIVFQLNSKTKWRMTSVSQTTKLGTNSAKEKNVAKMVIFLSAIFLICYLPSTVNFLMMILFPNFSFGGKYENMYILIWSLTVFVETINSSVNIFVYLRMSTKFRFAFKETFRAIHWGFH